ncbi:uncharacterized protein LY79DRAFT_182473 [Colletotrichum navitas]|uniref:Uncharacterized protein n=1 Tax=Colletotrichum navitas TaxID=681940 RepID=A0AAD8Q1T1_9PEZI|nr:uncharacterized protein LY79DRAFT_182473 [Colletotrichum navitas]KAK1593279.1 hypothetical protein LY79DRAFT_182473 [Colletotrichum navitas]
MSRCGPPTPYPPFCLGLFGSLRPKSRSLSTACLVKLASNLFVATTSHPLPPTKSPIWGGPGGHEHIACTWSPYDPHLLSPASTVSDHPKRGARTLPLNSTTSPPHHPCVTVISCLRPHICTTDCKHASSGIPLFDGPSSRVRNQRVHTSIQPPLVFVIVTRSPAPRLGTLTRFGGARYERLFPLPPICRWAGWCVCVCLQ